MSRPIFSASPARDAFFLAGAAGQTDQFTADEISYAVHSANLDANAVLTSDVPPLAYTRSINREVQPELDAARTISRLYCRYINTWPWLALKTSKHVSYLWRAFFRVMRGDSTYDLELARLPSSNSALQTLSSATI